MKNYGKSLGKVLVLNSSFEPMALTSVEKAIVLLYLEKVELVVASKSRVLRSAYSYMPFPSVVRVRDFVKLPFKKVPLTKRNVFRRDNYECSYCGSEDNLTVDHILPQSRGGEDSWLNLTTACKRCNNFKNDMTPEEAGMKLRRKPSRPNHILFLKAMSREVDDAWSPYLFS